MSKQISFIILLPFLLLSSCSICLLQLGRSEYFEIGRIPLKNHAERLNKFSSHSVEKQLDIYLFASKCIENPSIKGLLAETGDNKISEIVKRIQDSLTAEDKYYLIEALTDLQSRCNCIKQETVEVLKLEQEGISFRDTERQKFYKEAYKANLKLIFEKTKQ
jgi:hypothetical protein